MHRILLAVIGVFIAIVLPVYGADKALDFEENYDRVPYWQSQGRASDHLSGTSLDADLPTSMVFSLDESTLKSTLNRSFDQGIFGGEVYFPNTEGKMLRFDIREVSNFSPGLAAKYPNIKAYRGYSSDHPEIRLYFSYSPSGLDATFVDVGTRVKTTIKKISPKDHSYIAYTQLDDSKPRQALSCSTPEPSKISLTAARNSQVMVDLAGKMSPLMGFSDERTLTTYRLAVAVNGQYTAYHGGTVDSALAAINSTLTALNFIFETDIGIRLELIDDNDLIVYTDPDTDPFQDDPDNLNGTMNEELQVALDAVIGSENYDVGHIFSGIGGGGNAGAIGAFCNDDVKGSAWSASTQPEGGYFVNLVAHEMGHQLGANHTFSMRSEGTGTNIEPGSGTTIMSYAGITGPDDVALSGDDYYHNVSILQGLNYLKGQSCHINEDIDNNVPTVKALENYTIPVGTPFVLTGSATDVDESDVLTYTWEQVDDGVVPSSVFGPENTQGANFRSLPPSEDPTRYFPLLASVSSGGLTLSSPNVGSTWETLSTVPREFNFAFTARDNAAGGSGVASSRTKVTVVDNGGVFSVSSQSDGQLYLAGSEQAISWQVAGTDAPPILAESVNISLSVDGGLTYPYVLAENVSNDGSHNVTIPDVVSDAARVRVESASNIFYAINTRNFGVTRDDIVLTYSELNYPVCNNESVSASLTYETSSAFTDTAVFSSLNAPSSLSVGFSPVSATANKTPIDVTFSAAANIIVGTYPVDIIATSDIRTQSVTFNVSAYSSTFSPISLISPADQGVIDGLKTELQWQKQSNAVSYKVEVATDQNFSDLVVTSTVVTDFLSVTGLQRETDYYWRVTPVNSCGVAAAGNVYRFTTPNLFQAQTLPLVIVSDVANSISSTISISENLVITDINVGVDIAHTYVAELIITLTSPTGISLTLLQDACYVEDLYPIPDINAVFDDDGSDLVCGSSSPVVSGTLKPQTGSLDLFNEQSTQGDWVLSIEDIYPGDGGSLDNFTLKISTDGAYVNRAPTAVPQSVKAIPQGAVGVTLEAIDPEKQTLTYSMVDAPMRGELSVLAPSLLSSTDTSGSATKVTVIGNYAYVADYGSGLAIIDVSDPASPGTPAYINTTGDASGIAVRGNYAYVADGPSGLHIIDVSDPSSPSLLGTFDTDGYASDVTLSADGTKAYVADGLSGLHIINVSDSANPSSWGLFDTGGEALGVTLSNDSSKAYIANGFSGILIVDVRDASNLYSFGSLATLGNALGITLSANGGVAYIANGSAGLQVVDVSYAFEPILLGQLNTPGIAVDIELSTDGDIAYIAADMSGIQIINIEIASNPSLLGSFEAENTSGVALSADSSKAYVANGAGLQVVDVVPTIFVAGDVIPEVLVYTHTSQEVITDAATDTFTFKVNDGALDSNVAAVDLWMDSLSNNGTWTYLEPLAGSITITGCAPTFTFGIADVIACPTDLVIPETINGVTVTAIGDGAFAASNIVSVTIPNSVTSIGDYAFLTNNLTSVTFSDSVTVIGKNAFSNNKLFAVSFLGDRPSLASDSFFGNRALTHVSFCDGKPGWPGDSISVGFRDVEPIENCDSVNRNNGVLSELNAAVDSGDASGISAADLNSVLGLTNVDANNITVYQTAIEVFVGGAVLDELKEIQALIDSVNIAISSCSSSVYFVAMTAGSYPEEINWYLEDASGTRLYEGVAPFSGLICLGDARYTLRMADAYGDGWNGAEFSVLTTAGDLVISRTLISGSEGAAAVNVGDYPNEGPSANGQEVILVEKTPTDIALSATDPESDDLTYYLASEPTNGSFAVSFNPSLLGSFTNDDIAIDTVISSDGTKAFIADYRAGLHVIDISDASNPVTLSTLDTSGLAYNVAVSSDGNTAYVADEEAGLQIIDVSDSSNPSLLSTFDTEGFSVGVTLSIDGSVAYVADIYSLQIIDISNAQNPTLLGSLGTSGSAYGVALSSEENMAYVAVSDAGLDIIDISNSSNPTLVSTLDTPGSSSAVKLSNDDNTAYVTDDTFGLQIVDVTDSANPVILSNFDTDGNSWGLALSSGGSFAFVADLNSLQVIDVSNKLEPRSKGAFITSGSRGVALSSDDNTAYIAQENGLYIIDASLSSIQVGDKMPQVVSYTSTVAEAIADSFSFKVNDARLDSDGARVDITILLDTDGDGVTNEFDAFPLDPLEALDTDLDGIGNNADSDDDGDGVVDGLDVFPLDSTETLDTDLDGVGNNADPDDDGDGVVDGLDAFPLDSTEILDTDLDGIGNNADTDDDGDGVSDEDDALPLDPSNDSDSDGVANNVDSFPLDSTETADSDSDGVGDNSDIYPNNSLYAFDSDGDGMPDAWETRYGLNPNDASDATSDQDNDGVTALQEFLAGTIPAGSLDIDGNEVYDALTDGLLLLRGMFGLDGSALVSGTIGDNATYTSSEDVEARIAMLGDLSDIDGNGEIDALTDGLLTLRYLFGLEGEALVNGVIGNGATRTSASEIEAHLEALTPAP
ncbi:MAG: reprolysin-like metallopeptidase [Pseudomonadales bacterium]|jgi:hypothetical protein